MQIKKASMNNKNSFAIFIITTLLFINSCSTDHVDNSAVESKLDSLLTENNKLHEKINEVESRQQIDTKKSGVDIGSDKLSSTANDTLSEKKYAFVLLTTVKEVMNADKWQDDIRMERESGISLPKKGMEVRAYYVVSPIRSFDKLNDDLEYQFIDEVQNEYNNRSNSFYKAVIKKRECQIFNSYKEASVSRAKYTTNEE